MCFYVLPGKLTYEEAITKFQTEFGFPPEKVDFDTLRNLWLFWYTKRETARGTQ